MYYLKYYTLKAVKITIFPLLMSIILFIWYFYIQDTQIITRYISTEYYTYYDGFSRTVSHITYSHLKSNVVSFLIFSIIITIYNNKFTSYAYFTISITLSSILFIYYQNAVGFSVVISALYSIALLSLLISISKKSYEELISKRILINIELFILLVLIIFLNQFIIDFLFYFDYFTQFINEYYIQNQFSDYYTEKTSELHLIGFLMGVILFSIINMMKYTLLKIKG